MPFDPTSAAGFITAAVFGVAAGFERYRSYASAKKATASAQEAAVANAQQAANEELVKTKERVIETVKAEAEAWKLRFETEHTEFVDSRRANHDRVQEINAKLLNLAETNTELQAKTDLSPIVQFATNQTTTNAVMLEMTKQIVDTQHKILELLREHIKDT